MAVGLSAAPLASKCVHFQTFRHLFKPNWELNTKLTRWRKTGYTNIWKRQKLQIQVRLSTCNMLCASACDCNMLCASACDCVRASQVAMDLAEKLGVTVTEACQCFGTKITERNAINARAKNLEGTLWLAGLTQTPLKVSPDSSPMCCSERTMTAPHVLQ